MRSYAVVGRLALVLLPLGSVPQNVAAQSLTERQAVEAFTDTLDTVQSLQVVEALVTSPANRPAGRDAMLHLRAGLVQLRRGELTEGRSALDAAIRSFDETTIHASEWPWPWLGLARARVALSERRAVVKPSRHQPLGDLYEDAAARDIARALELDSAFAPAAHFLAELLAESPGDYPPALHRGIRAAASVPRHGASIQLLLGRLERHLHHDSLALEAFRRYRLAGGDAGVAALESARTRAQMGAPSAAVATYLEGARAAGAAGYAAYRADLAYVATAAELAAFDSLITSVPLQNRASDSGQASDSTAAGEWLATFWRRRDAASLRESGERLAEHLRRWVYAMREFRVMNRYWDTDGARTATRRADLGGGELMDIHSSLNELIVATTLTAPPVEGSVSLRHSTVDDLGFMYIRHGEPRARVHCPGGTLDEPPSVSWVYAMPEGTSIVHFSRGRLRQRRVSSPSELEKRHTAREASPRRHASTGLRRLIRASALLRWNVKARLPCAC